MCRDQCSTVDVHDISGLLSLSLLCADAEKVQRDFAAREQSLLQDKKQQQTAEKAKLATLKKKLQVWTVHQQLLALICCLLYVPTLLSYNCHVICG